MKRVFKILAWIIDGIVIFIACVAGFIFLKDVLNPEFKETKIYTDEKRVAPPDTVFVANGVPFKMIGVKGGKIDCRGLRKTIELNDFYISETEVTQQLWTAVMGDNPSIRQLGDSLPVENVDLVDCLDFTHKLDSITKPGFSIPSYPEWLYVAYLGNTIPDGHCLDSIAWHKGNSEDISHAVKQKNRNSIGVYDMLGNLAEWTLSGSDPLFFVAGGSFEDEMEEVNLDFYEFDHGRVKIGRIGFRLVYLPEKLKN